MWHRACALRDLPARQGYLLELGGEEIALFRVGDRVHALENGCPHRGAALAFGDLRGPTVYCPLHAWAFDVRTGACDEVPGACLRTFPVRVDGEDVLIEL